VPGSGLHLEEYNIGEEMVIFMQDGKELPINA